jgi:hypothetical protein
MVPIGVFLRLLPVALAGILSTWSGASAAQTATRPR